MKYLTVISGIIVAFAISLMLSGCSQTGENLSNKEQQKPVENVYKELNNLPQIAYPAIPINDNKSAGVKDEKTKVDGKKKPEIKGEEKKPEVKTETKTKDPRLADDSAMDPKNKFPENYNGK